MALCCVCLLQTQYCFSQTEETKEKQLGPFSIGANKKVFFSPGNLQYNAALGTHQCADGTTKQGTWRFAEHQWDMVGMGYGQTDETNFNYIGGTILNSDNRLVSSTYNGWIDLFGWGTSGWNSGAKAYEPWSTSTDYADYFPGNNPSNHLNGNYAYADWGIYNQIGDDPPASWRTLTKDEWVYLIKKRPNAKSKWGNAKVNGVTGLVLLPDEWSLPEGLAFTAGLISAEEWYDWSGLVATNIYTLPQWRKMEAAGAVFLPCAGYRYGRLSIYRTGTYGNYWSSTPRNSSTPYTMRFYSNTIYPDGNIGHNYGVSVRLVAEVIQPDQTIEETVLPDEHLCDGDTFLWLDGEYYTASQTLTYTDKSRKTGRDSVIIQSIVFHPVYTMPTEQASVRQGLAYRWQDNDYSEEGYYEKRLKTVYGCDSVLSLQLNVLHHIYTDFSAATCDNEPYYWDGMAYTEAGEYTRTYEAANGADSIVTLNLLVTPTYNMELTDTILYGTTYSWQNLSLSEEGDYEELLSSIGGCDSVLTLHLHTNRVEISNVSVADQCADDGFLNIEWQGSGFIDGVTVTVERLQPQAQTYPTVTLPIDNNTRYTTIPFVGRAGLYQAQTDFLYKGLTAYSLTVPFTLLYPSSVFKQMWNDVIAVRTQDGNGGYDFVAFEWLKDGLPIAGQTRSYLYLPLVMGAEYSALLTEADGTKLMSCPLVAGIYTDLNDYTGSSRPVSICPNVSRPAEQVNCRVTEPSDMTLYDATGRVVMTQQNLHAGDNTFLCPNAQGTYLVLVRTQRHGTTHTLKLIVQ